MHDLYKAKKNVHLRMKKSTTISIRWDFNLKKNSGVSRGWGLLGCLLPLVQKWEINSLHSHVFTTSLRPFQNTYNRPANVNVNKCYQLTNKFKTTKLYLLICLLYATHPCTLACINALRKS